MLQAQRNYVWICKISLVLFDIFYTFFKRNKNCPLTFSLSLPIFYTVHIQTQCRKVMGFLRFAEAESGK